jgi:hypothetical protein
MVDSKLYFHCHVDFVYSQTLRTLGLIRFITYNFSSLHSLVVLYIALIRSKLEYASIVWNKLKLINVFKGKINFHSFMDTVGTRVPTRQIREFSTFSVSSALRQSFSQVRHCCK